jgi:hypothetical protein
MLHQTGFIMTSNGTVQGEGVAQVINTNGYVTLLKFCKLDM